jgi:phospholipase C
MAVSLPHDGRLGVVTVLTVCAALTAGSRSAPAASIGLRPGVTPAAATAAATATPIKHVVVIMEENHSFDNYFGTFPGANGIPSGVCVPDPATQGCDAPYHVATEFTHALPHDYPNAVGDVNQGKMNGFIAQEQQFCNCKTHQSMGHFDATDIPVYWRYAENYALQDNFFEPVLSWGYPAHLSMLSAWSAHCASATNPMSCTGSNTPGLGHWKSWPSTTLPWTDLTWLLHKNAVSWGYYVAQGTQPVCSPTGCTMASQNPGTPTIWNPLPWFLDVQQDGELGNIKSQTSLYSDLSNGNLPAVSWVVPNYAESALPGWATNENSEPYVVNLINAIESSSAWSSTAILLTWSDWGGQYDQVRPPAEGSLGYGLRVPSIVISPYTKTGYIDHQLLSFDAYTKFIEDNFMGGQRLDPATDGRPDSRPAVAEANPALGDLTNDFDFSKAPAAPVLFPTITVPAGLSRGTQASVSGANFSPGDTVHVILNCGAPDCTHGVTVATATAALDGTFSATFTVPTSLPTGKEYTSAAGSDALTYFAINSTSVS